MGASAWDYVVPYAEDTFEALRELRQTVLREHEYRWHGDYDPSRTDMPATMAELWADEWVQEAGTHSILDMHEYIEADEADRPGALRPLTEAEVLTYLGSDRPTRARFTEAFGHGGGPVAVWGPRWSGYTTTLYDEAANPVETAFWGCSGD